jgi:hypothetical protein
VAVQIDWPEGVSTALRGAPLADEDGCDVDAIERKDRAAQMRQIRRVVTGTDREGRSCVVFDSAAPKVNRHVSASMTDVWVYGQNPAPLGGPVEDGDPPFQFEPPHHGGHLRFVQSIGRAPDYNAARDPLVKPRHDTVRSPSGASYRGGENAFSSPYHKSDTVDYGIVIEGERVLRLDEGDFPMRPHDVVVQLGNWHGWTNPTADSLMAFVMMGWEIVD